MIIKSNSDALRIGKSAIIIVLGLFLLSCNTAKNFISLPKALINDLDSLREFIFDLRKTDSISSGYQPVDSPFLIQKAGAYKCNETRANLKEYPNEDMRIYIAKLDQSENISYGVAGSISE